MTANTLAICVATMTDPFHAATIEETHPDVATWTVQASFRPKLHFWYNTPEDNRGVVGAYEQLYRTTDEDVLLFIHDDVICREQDWDLRLMAEFVSDDSVAVCGFGGALSHGLPNLYKVPYQLQQLQRGDYRSNVDDAEVHGERFTGSCNVAVLDGFALAVRRSFLDRIGGFAKISVGCNFIAYDYALCALARRYKHKVRMVGIKCHHRGGQTSVEHAKDDSVKQYINQDAYNKAHEWFYREFADVMPAKGQP